jgi:putative ABC transport system substrate-binding protein
MTLVHQNDIVGLAAKHRVPAIYESREWVEAGGLMSYGAMMPEVWRYVAECVDKILRGSRPADVPVRAPRPLEFHLRRTRRPLAR